MESHIRFSSSAALVTRLGEELIKDPHTAFFELIKNGYDADATEIHVSFRKSAGERGTISIRDDGCGMSLEDLRTKWARAAGENKVREPYTRLFRRRMLGAKGIGRFSAAKLGASVKVITRQPGSPTQLVFTIDFDQFTDDKDFHDMELDYKEGAPRAGFTQGTILEIERLRTKWGKKEIRKIRDQLCHLIDPDRRDENFSIRFDCPEWPELSGPLENPISGRESHRVTFRLDADGAYESELRVGTKLARRKEQRGAPRFGPVEGVLRYYKEGVKSRDRRLAEDVDESHMGVKVYRDACRVRPYGEPSDDWLEVKARRARGGGKYFVQAQSLAGTVYISATLNDQLKDATNREAGIIENDAFREFQAFVAAEVEILNEVLEQETRSESHREKRRTVRKILDTVVDCLNRQESDAYKGYVERIDRGRRGSYGQSAAAGQTTVVVDVKPATKDEWHCLDCDSNWRVWKDETPARCMDLAVNRQGERRNASGCGSTNIERAGHAGRDEASTLSSVVSGDFALVAGRQLRIRVDYEMGAHEDEYRVDEREILVNGNHPAYAVAERLDGLGERKYEIGDDVFVPALTTHIAKCACLAWAELHYAETRKWDEFKERYDALLGSICKSILSELT